MRKNVLITGAAGNLGKVVTNRFLEEGFGVIAIVSPGKKSTLSGDQSLQVYEADLANETETSAVVKEILNKHNTIDVALLLAGGFAMGGIADTDKASLQSMISINFETAYFITRAVFGSMMESKSGRIILVGSNPALVPSLGKNYLAYSLSKSMLFKLAEFLNAEGNGHNVITSVVVPGTIDTPANRKAMPNADFNKWVSPEDIANAMIYLTSERASSLRDPILKILGS